MSHRVRVRVAVALAVIACLGLTSPPTATASPAAMSAETSTMAGKVFPERWTTARVPIRGLYDVTTGQTLTYEGTNVRVRAKSDGTTVLAKVKGQWIPIPYTYVPARKKLLYQHSLLIELGYTQDPLGGATPAYRYPPTLPPAPTGVTTGPYDVDAAADAALGAGWREGMLAQVNAFRAEKGVPPVTLCQNLSRSAQGWANYIAQHEYFGHSIHGWSPWDRMAQAGYGTVPPLNGENIARRFPSVNTVMAGWKDSANHYHHIMNPGYTQAGFGAAMSPGGEVYWVQNYGGGGTC